MTLAASMKFSVLARILREKGVALRVEADGDPLVSNVFSDSRSVLPGALFCCVRGEKDDGHLFAGQAKEMGACALLCEETTSCGLPSIVVPSVREVMGTAASAVYGEPASKLLMVGVTGTNGKSTTTYILRSILQAAGIRSGLLGTIVENDGLRERDADRTTPESCVIQRQLATMVKNGCGSCVMETSSHGLFAGRLNGCLFDLGVFTNLNPEHLDFHVDMENYFQAKRLLFARYTRAGFTGAVNAADPYGRRLLDEFPAVTRGFGPVDDAFARVTESRSSTRGTDVAIEMRGYPSLRLESPLVGAFNVWNVLAAVTALRGRVSDEAIVRGVAAIPQVPGRLERHVMPNGACCFIDFAHTPEALKNVLAAARELCSGRLVSVFGHGGGRYPLNRQALGGVAASFADQIIVTMDNPRDEEPADIAASIVQGIVAHNENAKYQVVLNRKEAIYTALGIAGPNDVVVISGKGPEKYLVIKDKKIPYNDAETVESWKRF